MPHAIPNPPEPTAGEETVMRAPVAALVVERPAESGPGPVAAPARGWDRRHRVGVMVVLVVVAVWLLVAVSLQLTGSGKAHGGNALPGWIHALPGGVVSVDQDHSLLRSAPDGSGTVPQPNLANFDIPSGLVESPDARNIADSWGDLLGTAAWRVIPNNIDSELDASAELATAPFSDGNQALVVLSTGATVTGASAPVAEVSLVWPGDHHVTPLGTADDAAGDPRMPGAFITVAASLLDPGGLYELPVPDRAVELLDVGVAPRLVVTSDRLNGVLHQALATPLNLTVYPDPGGDKLAVVVSPLDGNQRAFPGGVVIVSRSGQILGVGPALNGPGRWAGTSRPSWSPDGRSLVYVPLNAPDQKIVEWTTGEALKIRSVAGLATSASCLWAPNSAAILCPTGRASGPGPQWLLARAAGGHFVPVAAPGAPVAWVPGE